MADDRELGPALPVEAGEFEGPLDLLLVLVRRRQVRLENIPIAHVTSQYLAWLREARERRIALGGEFVEMAATLIYLKSRWLLGREEEDRAAGDVRRELIDRLREHERARAAAALLGARGAESAGMLSHAGERPPGADDGVESADDDGLASLADLIDILQEAAGRAAAAEPPMELATETETLERWAGILRTRLAETDHVDGTALLEAAGTPEARACLFLAMLEAARAGEAEVDQEDVFGPIRIVRNGKPQGLHD
jgi:segregation and condensation protein A